MTPVLTTLAWVPEMPRGYVRDIRARWACEEVGQPYALETINFACAKGANRAHQPFGQVPNWRDEEVALFESGAIVLRIAERAGKLLGDGPAARSRAIQWLIAALNSIEPQVMELFINDVVEKDRPWSAARREAILGLIDSRLTDLGVALGERTWLDGDAFTVGDLMMVAVLHGLDQPILDRHPVVAAYVARGKARPGFAKAHADQMALYAGAAPDPTPEATGRVTMPYIDGFVLAVPTADKQKFIDHARLGDSVFMDMGATRILECWGDDVPAGKQTDFARAVQAKEDETVCFSWIEWPDKATRDAAMEKMMAGKHDDPRLSPEHNPMPFDGKRMIYGGFEPVVTLEK